MIVVVVGSYCCCCCCFVVVFDAAALDFVVVVALATLKLSCAQHIERSTCGHAPLKVPLAPEALLEQKVPEWSVWRGPTTVQTTHASSPPTLSLGCLPTSSGANLVASG